MRYVRHQKSKIERGFFDIVFFRHAKRRVQLYQIPEPTILKILEAKELYPGIFDIIQNVRGSIGVGSIIFTKTGAQAFF